MAKIGNNFVFYREETLTDPAGTVFVFKFSDTYPIWLNEGGSNDLQLYLDWDQEGAADLCMDLLTDLIMLNVLSLDIGFVLWGVVEELKGQPLYFNQTLSKFFTIDLMGLEKKSIEIDFPTLQLTNERLTIDTLSEFLPEFILDFGEGLEENLTYCWVGGVGILDKPYVNHYDPKTLFESSCARYMAIENAYHVIEHLDTHLIEEQFERHLKEAMAPLSEAILDYDVTMSPLKNLASFLSLLDTYKNSLPANAKFTVFDMYKSNLLEENKVKIEVHIQLTYPVGEPFTASEYNAFTNNLYYLNSKNSTLHDKGSSHPANVWWEIANLRCVSKTEEGSSWFLNIHVRFGNFR